MSTTTIAHVQQLIHYGLEERITQYAPEAFFDELQNDITLQQAENRLRHTLDQCPRLIAIFRWIKEDLPADLTIMNHQAEDFVKEFFKVADIWLSNIKGDTFEADEATKAALKAAVKSLRVFSKAIRRHYLRHLRGQINTLLNKIEQQVHTEL